MDKQDTTPNNISDKKKRGRKKNVIAENTNTNDSETQEQNGSVDENQNIVVEVTKEKKERKKRTKKGETSIALTTETDSENLNTNETIVKKRKRRTRKDIDNLKNADKSKNIIISNSNNGDEMDGVGKQKNKLKEINSNHDDNDNNNGNNINNSNHENDNSENETEVEPKEEKVAKKRGRKPKGGKITIQPQTNNNIQNELPNIILHLKCSLSDLNKNNTETAETFDVKNNNVIHSSNINNSQCIESIQSYSSLNEIGSEISNIMGNEISNTNISLCQRDLVKKSQLLSNVHNMITKEDSNAKNGNISLNETYSSAMFPVYDPCVLNDTHTNSLPPPISCSMSCSDASNQIINKNSSSLFSTIYSPDIISYNNQAVHDDDCSNPANLNERDIWKKINQLKLSFHKSDICQNIRGAQRSACFWCTCEFDSPAIYIPKSVLKDMYNVYGCFCSPECAAAFLMNESIDTSTKFERYHLLNSLYGKIYKYEKSIKIAPNPYYLLNKFYGTLTIQEYRKLFQSDQMIYVVNKPLTHILPELYEDNNDFLLNNKIIPTNSVNLKKKVLKSNV